MRARSVWSLGALLSLAVAACSMPPPELIDAGGGVVDGPPIDGNTIDGNEDVASLTSTQTSNDFGDVTVDQESGVFQVTVQNTGTAPSGAIGVTLAGTNASDFVIVPTGDTTDCQGATLDVDATCIAQVRFRPSAAGARSASLEIAATPGGTVTVDLSGNGLSPGALEITAGATISFGTIEIASASSPQTVTVRNTGGTTTAALTVTLSSHYTKGTDTCHGATLAAGASCSVEVSFTPGSVGGHAAQLSVRESDVIGVSASLSGTGSARLQVNKTGTGTVTSTPAGLSCGTGCTTQTASFTQTPVTLTAAAGTDFAFDAWTGVCAGQGATCSATLDSPLETTAATFVQLYTLTVSTTGSGTVTSAPAGIDCGTDCSEAYGTGTMVTLTASPGAGNDVYAWTGAASACAQGATTCTIAMTANRSVGVEFRPRYTLTVSTSGSGSVTGSGINCPGTCSTSLFSGTAVSLTQTPGSAGTGSRNIFGGWGGACTGTGACSFTMDASKTVSAAFTLQHRITVTPAGTGTGTVTSTPSGLNCGATCQAYFNDGATVALAETHNAATVWFDGWSGDCPTGTCTMNAPKAVTATFRTMSCTPDTIVCDDATDHYVDCSPTGTIDFEMDCNPELGCATGVEKCLEVNPSNGLAAQLDLASSGPDVTFSGTSTINSSTGVVNNGGTTLAVPNEVVNGIRVFRFNSLSIGGNVKVSGTSPLALVVAGDVNITGTLDVSADGKTNGPGIRSSATTCDGTDTTGTFSAPGGGGAGRMNVGGSGGDSGSATGGAGGSALNDGDLVPLQGGCQGGDVTVVQNNIGYGSDGGGGGGAVQIVSRTRIVMTGTGIIDASGGGGRTLAAPPSGSTGGGGGGSGGGVLLEAPQILLNGSGVVISTKGGGGGAATSGQANTGGADGGTGPGPAAGGTNGTYAAGGAGGTEVTGEGPKPGADGTGSGGGGGGSVGQARFNNLGASVLLQNGAVVRSKYLVGSIGTRQLP